MSIYSCRQHYEAGEVLTLVALGFFFPAARKLKDVRVKCSFCRKTFRYGARYAEFLHGARYEEFMPHSTSEGRTASLLQRHAVLSPTCPAAIGINGDNRPLTQSEINRFMSKHYVCALSPDCFPAMSSHSEDLLLRLSRQLIPTPTGREGQRGVHRVIGSPETASESLPDIDDERYIHYRSQFDVEPYAEFNALEYCWSEFSNLDGYQSPLEMLDYMIGMEPARQDMWQLAPREQTFIDLNWSAHVSFRNPSWRKIAKAGFFYTGKADCVRCFWCSLGLNCWDPGDDPWREHARFSPRCPWLLRCRGRPFVRQAILSDLQSATPAAIGEDTLLILTSWGNIPGRFSLLTWRVHL